MTQASKAGEMRCILLYSPISPSCFATENIGLLLDRSKWGNVLIIFDTSYGGSAGYADLSSSDTRLRSRTYKSHKSRDTLWRREAGIRNNRHLIVASNTNQPALKSDEF